MRWKTKLETSTQSLIGKVRAPKTALSGRSREAQRMTGAKPFSASAQDAERASVLAGHGAAFARNLSGSQGCPAK
jgi:hypothetical protein